MKGDPPSELSQEQHATFPLERRLDAPPAAVFAAWAEPALKRRWFGEADGWEDVEHRLDFRVGGSEYASASTPGGPRHENETVILNNVTERRLVCAHPMETAARVRWKVCGRKVKTRWSE